MTRKDYINIAGAILATQARIKAEFERKYEEANYSEPAAIRYGAEQDYQLRGVRRAAAHLADFLADDNPRFDKARFLKACGYGFEAEQERILECDLIESGAKQEREARARGAYSKARQVWTTQLGSAPDGGVRSRREDVEFEKEEGKRCPSTKT